MRCFADAETIAELVMLRVMGIPDLLAEARGGWRWEQAEPLADAARQDLRNLLTGFAPIPLSQIGCAVLLDRFEVKYVLPEGLLAPVLAELSDSYRVLVVGGEPASRYRTLYFDTDDLAMYRRHHAGAPDRYKVRAREYVDSHASYLEVKHKTGERRTVKDRIPIQAPVAALSPQSASFLAQACPYPADALVPSLWNHYTRITLVSKYRAERVTLDFDLAFMRNTEQVTLPGIVVAEVKYAGLRQGSEFVRLMRRFRVRETGFSKYCMGVSLLYPGVKHNRFKAKQLLVARLTPERSGSWGSQVYLPGSR